MDFLLYFIVLWVADYLYFRIRFTRSDGPPVWYLFPFVGILPLYLLPKSLFLRYINWYFKNAPDVIITRCLLYPCIIVKNSAVEEAQNQEKILSRPAFHWFSTTMGYVQSRKLWYVADGGFKDVPWQSLRKTNLAALNVLSKQQKFERTAEVVDHFLKTIEDHKDRFYDYRNDLSFSKLQEACNVNLGKSFERNNIQTFVKTALGFMDGYSLIFLLCTVVPLPILLMFERFLPKNFQPSRVRRVYSKLIARFAEEKLQSTDEPRDFFEAVLRVKKIGDAIEFFQETLLLNVLATSHTTMHTTMATLSYIALDKRVQAKLHKEIDQVVGSSPLNYEHLNHLHYLKAVIHEANRMNPPIPKILRQTTDTVRVGGYTLPSNMLLLLYFVSETVDTKNFPDPYDFIPERFITENGEFATSKHFSIFSRGKRRCSGIETANLSQQVHLAKILQHFALIPKDPQTEVPGYCGTALTKSPMIPMKFVRREGAPVIKPPDLDSGLSAIVQELLEKESE